MSFTLFIIDHQSDQLKHKTCSVSSTSDELHRLVQQDTGWTTDEYQLTNQKQNVMETTTFKAGDSVFASRHKRPDRKVDKKKSISRLSERLQEEFGVTARLVEPATPYKTIIGSDGIPESYHEEAYIEFCPAIACTLDDAEKVDVKLRELFDEHREKSSSLFDIDSYITK